MLTKLMNVLRSLFDFDASTPMVDEDDLLPGISGFKATDVPFTATAVDNGFCSGCGLHKAASFIITNGRRYRRGKNRCKTCGGKVTQD